MEDSVREDKVMEDNVMDRPIRALGNGPGNGPGNGSNRRACLHWIGAHVGFSLIEVLVTLLIMALGLSGWALLLALGVSNQHDAYARTQATLITSALLERIRIRQLATGAPELAAYATAHTESERNTCDLNLVTPDNDRICWYQSLDEQLPFGTGRISVSGEQILIEAFWFDATAARRIHINDREKCEDPAGADRIWSENPLVNWVPVDSAPRPTTCLQVQRWSLPL